MKPPQPTRSWSHPLGVVVVIVALLAQAVGVGYWGGQISKEIDLIGPRLTSLEKELVDKVNENTVNIATLQGVHHADRGR